MFEQETNSSPWLKIHPTFKVHSVFHGGKKSTHWQHKNKLFNHIRLITIKGFAYLEVKTQKPEITFLCDISNYTKLRSHIWYTNKKRNLNYITTTIKKDNKYTLLLFHRLIYPEYKLIDHINRESCDNREINLREITNRENALNCKLMKNNTSGYNGISFYKKDKVWRFDYYENRKHKGKTFKTKQEAIKFKLEHDLATGNMNGKLV
jgi:hypothetical protein